MPSLIGQTLLGGAVNSVQYAQNYRKTEWSSRFGTRELVIATITAVGATFNSDYSLTTQDQYGTVLGLGSTNAASNQAGTVDGLFSKAVYAIQTIGEIYAIGQPTATAFTVILAADTLGDKGFQDNTVANGNQTVPSLWSDNGNATTLQTVIANATGITSSNITVVFTRLYGASYA